MSPSQILGQLPLTLKEELVESFNEIVHNFRQNRWGPTELNGGKLCEVVYCIIKGNIDGTYPLRSSKPANMVVACRALEQYPPTFSRSIRVQIPRILIALYEVRNNRGVGHVGGEVDPNHMDATMVLYLSKWIMSELVRIFHNLDTTTATNVVETLINKEQPLIWQIGDKKRILNKNLSMKNKTLLLLYSEPNSVTDNKLFEWTDHTNMAVYKRDILCRGHREIIWEYNKSTHELSISPLGIKYVEEKIIPNI